MSAPCCNRKSTTSAWLLSHAHSKAVQPYWKYKTADKLLHGILYCVKGRQLVQYIGSKTLSDLPIHGHYVESIACSEIGNQDTSAGSWIRGRSLYCPFQFITLSFSLALVSTPKSSALFKRGKSFSFAAVIY